MAPIKYTTQDYERFFRLLGDGPSSWDHKIDLIKRVEREYGVRYERGEAQYILQTLRKDGLIDGARGLGYKRIAPEFTDLSHLAKKKKRIKQREKVKIETTPDPALSRHGQIMAKLQGIEAAIANSIVHTLGIERKLDDRPRHKLGEDKTPFSEYIKITPIRYAELIHKEEELKMMRTALKGRLFNPFR